MEAENHLLGVIVDLAEMEVRLVRGEQGTTPMFVYKILMLGDYALGTLKVHSRQNSAKI